jgi:hypothetical protein
MTGKYSGPSGETPPVVVDEEGDGVIIEIDRTGSPAVVVEDSGAEDQPADQLGSHQRGRQGHRRPIAVADEVGRSADDPLEKGDRVHCHLLITERAFDVRRATVTASIGPEHAEVPDEAWKARLPGA